MQSHIKELEPVIKEAGDIVLKLESQINRAEHDSAFPSTEADKAVSDFLYPRLKAIEDIPILDEERTDDIARLQAERIWIVDPIDGTKDLIEGTGEYVVMCAIVEDHKPVLSIMYQPKEDVLYYAEKGKGAYKVEGGNTTQLSIQGSVQHVRMISSRFHESETINQFALKLGVEKKVPRGSMGLKMASIAEGIAHVVVYFTDKTGEWDSAPGSLLITEAGGRVTDFRGADLMFNKPQPRNQHGILAAHPGLHERALEVIEGIEYNFE
ncbi:MAG: 3'(2'),5'-bisphosphate nucleotidase CysQ family protein [Patescibacteria group bacterium]